jgi:hypothetical protein
MSTERESADDTEVGGGGGSDSGLGVARYGSVGSVPVGRYMPVRVPVRNTQVKSKQFGTIYHGTTHDFKPGDIVNPSTKSELSNGNTAFAHASTDYKTANQYATGKMVIKGKNGQPLLRFDGKPVTMNRGDHPRNPDKSFVRGNVYEVKPLSAREVKKTTKSVQPGLKGMMDSGADHLVSSKGFKVVRVVTRGD